MMSSLSLLNILSHALRVFSDIANHEWNNPPTPNPTSWLAPHCMKSLQCTETDPPWWHILYWAPKAYSVPLGSDVTVFWVKMDSMYNSHILTSWWGWVKNILIPSCQFLASHYTRNTVLFQSNQTKWHIAWRCLMHVRCYALQQWVKSAD